MPPLLGAIVVSACLGALVGLIRQWSDQRSGPRKMDFGGVRTFALWSLFGCLSAFISSNYSPVVLPLALLIVGGFLISVHLRNDPRSRPGTTTFVAALLTFFVGAMVEWDLVQAAVVVAALTTVMLGIKGPVHAWTRSFTVEDIHSTLQFAAITGVVLPLVPNQTYGPFDAFNPYTTWLMVVLISGLGFIGYIAMRLLGPRLGIFATSLCGGLASSTVATLAFSRESREDATRSLNYSFAVVVACTVMLPRLLVVVGIVNFALVRPLLLPLGLMALPAVGYGLWLWRRHPSEAGAEAAGQIGNPLRLSMAIKFAVLYSFIAFVVKAATAMHWTTGLLPLSFVSGLTDVDAISLSVAGSQASGATTLPLAGQAIVLAAIANSLLKGALAVSFGSPLLRRHVPVVLGLTALIGAAGLMF